MKEVDDKKITNKIIAQIPGYSWVVQLWVFLIRIYVIFNQLLNHNYFNLQFQSNGNIF